MTNSSGTADKGGGEGTKIPKIERTYLMEAPNKMIPLNAYDLVARGSTALGFSMQELGGIIFMIPWPGVVSSHYNQ